MAVEGELRAPRPLRSRVRIIVLIGLACAAAWLAVVTHLGVWRLDLVTQRQVAQAAGEARSVALTGAQGLARRMESLRTIPQLLAGQERFAVALSGFDLATAGTAQDEWPAAFALGSLRSLSLDLTDLAYKLNLEAIMLTTPEGFVVASSDGGNGESHLGTMFVAPDLVAEAMRSGHAERVVRDDLIGEPTFVFCNVIADDAGQPVGVVIVATSSSRLLLRLQRGSETVMLSDANNIVIVASRDDLLYRAVGTPNPAGFDDSTMEQTYGRSDFLPVADELMSETVDDVVAAKLVHASVAMSDSPLTIHVVTEMSDLAAVRRDNLVGTIGLALFGVLLTAVVALALAQIEAFKERATRDPLTGLSNRRYADEVLPRLLELDDRGRLAGLALVSFDLDHFKGINDSYGHQVGDRALRRFAQIMVDSVRRSDLVFRIGGEEFIAVLIERDIDGALSFAERVRAATEAIADMAPIPPGRITVSAGVALRAPGEDFEALVARADRLLYLAKKNGRNRIESETVG